MCLARVETIGKEEGPGQGLLKDVAHIERTPTGLRVTDLVGNVTELEAEIRSIDFVDSVVAVERREDSAAAE